MKKFLRMLAILLAVYFLLTSLDNIFGFRSGNFSPSAIPWRFRQSFVSFVAAVLLLVNPKKLKSGGRLFVYFAGLFAVSIWYSLVFVQGSGRIAFLYRKPASAIVGLLILAILWGTFWSGLNDRFARPSRK